MTVTLLVPTRLQSIDTHLELGYTKGAWYRVSTCIYSHRWSLFRCLLKVANLSAALGSYEKAISVYQEVTRRSVDSPLLKYSVKEYIFRELLCQMCVDVTEAQKALERYGRTCPIFQDSREDRLMRKLIDCVEEGDEAAFGEAVASFDEISRLDQWFTTMLLRIKRDIGNKCSLR